MITVLLLMHLANAAHAADATKQDLKVLADQVAEVRRDELNYQIERDLLKETYSTNIAHINIVIAIVLGSFSLIGYFGLRDITQLKDSYTKELAALSKLQGEFRQKCELTAQQHDAVLQRLKETAEINASQDTRIKLLELTEKANDRIKNKEFSSALQFADFGLELDTNNPSLWYAKAYSLLKLQRHLEARDAYTRVRALQPTSGAALINLLEVNLFLGDTAAYDRLRTAEIPLLQQYMGAYFPFLGYFDALKLYILNDIAPMKAKMRECIIALSSLPPLKWEFDDVMAILANHPNPNKAIVIQFITALANPAARQQFLGTLG